MRLWPASRTRGRPLDLVLVKSGQIAVCAFRHQAVKRCDPDLLGAANCIASVNKALRDLRDLRAPRGLL